MGTVLEAIENVGIVPVVVLEEPSDALPLGQALVEGGLPCAEVTFRTDAAEESLRIMASQCPDLLVGAGTVLSVEQVKRAVDAGAKFIVSPGLNPSVVQYCLENDIPITPGIQTPTEIEAALSLGVDVVKFFPAEPAGGLGMLKALAAPYTSVRFIPTGGINAQNVKDYLAWNRVLACGGSWMVKGSLVKEKKFDDILALVREAASVVAEIRPR